MGGSMTRAAWFSAGLLPAVFRWIQTLIHRIITVLKGMLGLKRVWSLDQSPRRALVRRARILAQAFAQRLVEWIFPVNASGNTMSRG